ncbi:hypothetical protein CHS0354_017980 [Potamilus streckersoni]|uniref:Uncharacterized protein n=1 Tax=Potamilus streckersoni TaxID=2493646 RepID=A0AAE0VL03_9BIVA|nr:hypothetical protein CHS0354_017980 [Potamilus streckersoni]
MSFQYDQIRAEMEVNRILQNVIVAHHIIQVVSLVLGIIICGATSYFFLMMIHLTPILPAFIFVVFWIASKCNFKSLRHILVHFNFILSLLWFMAVFPIFIMSIIFPMDWYDYYYSREFNTVPLVVGIVNGILSLSSISFTVCAIWKAARNVVLKANLATQQHIDGHNLTPFPCGTGNALVNHNGIQMPQAPYGLPMWTQR